LDLVVIRRTQSNSYFTSVPLQTLQNRCPQRSQTAVNFRVRFPHLQHLIAAIRQPFSIKYLVAFLPPHIAILRFAEIHTKLFRDLFKR
jgi:hypothetical protein